LCAHEAYKSVLLCSDTSGNLLDRRYNPVTGEIHRGEGVPPERGSDPSGGKN